MADPASCVRKQAGDQISAALRATRARHLVDHHTPPARRHNNPITRRRATKLCKRYARERRQPLVVKRVTLMVGRFSRLVAGDAIGEFAAVVEVAIVPSGLRDQVRDDVSQRERLAATTMLTDASGRRR